MNASPRGLSSGQNPSWSLAFWNRVHRYRVLVQKFWWVLVLTLSICLFAAAWHQINRPVTYLSAASLTADLEHTGPHVGDQQGGVVPQDADDYMAKLVPVITKGKQIQQMAVESLQAKYPNLLASPVSLSAAHDNGILSLTATGTNAEYTQRYLQEIVRAFFNSRKEQRQSAGDDAYAAIRTEIEEMRATLSGDDEAMNAFQRKNNVVFDKEDGSDADTTLAALRQKIATLKDETSTLAMMTPEQGLKGTGGATQQALSANGVARAALARRAGRLGLGGGRLTATPSRNSCSSRPSWTISPTPCARRIPTSSRSRRRSTPRKSSSPICWATPATRLRPDAPGSTPCSNRRRRICPPPRNARST